MLPPPITKPIWHPLSAACLTCRAMSVTSSMPMPRSPAWLKLSPESLRMTRVKRGESAIGSLAFAQFPVHKLFHLHALVFCIFADRRAVLFHERLLEQDLLGVEVLEPPFDHLIDDVGRLAFGQ